MYEQGSHLCFLLKIHDIFSILKLTDLWYHLIKVQLIVLAPDYPLTL